MKDRYNIDTLGQLCILDEQTQEYKPIPAAIQLPSQMPITPTISNALNTMQSEAYRSHFKEDNNPTALIQSQLKNSELPLGLLQTLISLKEYDFDFIVDDSGSMVAQSDVKFDTQSKEIHEAFKQFLHVTPSPLLVKNGTLTRWSEAANRLFWIIDTLACVPTGHINIRFMNRDASISLTPDMRKEKSIDDLKQSIYQNLKTQFLSSPNGGTPTKKVLQQAFSTEKNHDKKTIHLLLTDGEPSDCNRPFIQVSGQGSQIKSEKIFSDLIEEVRTRGKGYGFIPEDREAFALNEDWQDVVKGRAGQTYLDTIMQHADKHHLMLLSCTSESLPFLDRLDVDSPRVGTLDDYKKESQQVKNNHGNDFNYPVALWALVHIAGTVSPLLDALDDPCALFTREAYQLFMPTGNHDKYVAMKREKASQLSLVLKEVNVDGSISNNQSHCSIDPNCKERPAHAPMSTSLGNSRHGLLAAPPGAASIDVNEVNLSNTTEPQVSAGCCTIS